MPDPHLFFYIPENAQSDFNEADYRSEFEQMRIRNRAINNLLSGSDEQAIEEILDILSSQGYNPDEYLEHTATQMAIAIDDPSLIWTP